MICSEVTEIEIDNLAIAHDYFWNVSNQQSRLALYDLSMDLDGGVDRKLYTIWWWT